MVNPSIDYNKSQPNNHNHATSFDCLRHGLDGNEFFPQNWHGNRLQTIQSEKVKTIAGTLDPEIVQYTIQSSGGLIDCVLKE